MNIYIQVIWAFIPYKFNKLFQLTLLKRSYNTSLIFKYWFLLLAIILTQSSELRDLLNNEFMTHVLIYQDILFQNNPYSFASFFHKFEFIDKSLISLNDIVKL